MFEAFQGSIRSWWRGLIACIVAGWTSRDDFLCIYSIKCIATYDVLSRRPPAVCSCLLDWHINSKGWQRSFRLGSRPSPRDTLDPCVDLRISFEITSIGYEVSRCSLHQIWIVGRLRACAPFPHDNLFADQQPSARSSGKSRPTPHAELS